MSYLGMPNPTSWACLIRRRRYRMIRPKVKANWHQR